MSTVEQAVIGYVKASNISKYNESLFHKFQM